MTSEKNVTSSDVSSTVAADISIPVEQDGAQTAAEPTLDAEPQVVAAPGSRGRGVGVTALRRDGTPRLGELGDTSRRDALAEGEGGISGKGEQLAEGRGNGSRRATQLDELRERRIAKMGGRRPRPNDAFAQIDGEDPSAEAGDQPEPRIATVSPAKMRTRHYGVLLSMCLMVLAPIGLAAWYLWTHAADQYESRVGFTVRAEGQAVAPDLFGGLLGSSGGSTSEDMSILSAYIISQEMVELLDAKLDLRAKFSVPTEDPIYAYDPKGTIEDLVTYWQRMVVVDHNTSSGLMELTVYAFSAQDAQEISAAVLDQSGKVINNLSAIAREDSTRYARENLENARARANASRAALAAFRVKNKVADPAVAVASQMGVVSSLQHDLASALVELDLIRAASKANDPRIVQLERRITIIEGRIEQERSNVGIGADGAGFAELLSEYESLTVETTFAEQTYLAARAGFDSAMSSAAQQSRYLASFVLPTRAEASTAPDRPMATLIIGLIAFFIWASVVLIYYALRDRR